MRVGVKCYLEPHDVFVGVYWKRALALESLPKRVVRPVTTIYLCPFFCFVVRVTVEGRERKF